MLEPGLLLNDFGLIAPDENGRSAVRADMGAFFVCSGLAALASLFPGQRHWLLGAIALFSTAFLGRLFGVFMAGATQGIISAMLIEAACIAALVFAYIVFGLAKRRAETKAAAPQITPAAPEQEQQQAVADQSAEPASTPVANQDVSEKGSKAS